MNPIDVFFHWPEGGIWSNLIASVIWATPVVIYSRLKITKLHKEAKVQREDNMKLLVDLHEKHHKEVLEAVHGQKRNR